MVNWCQLDPLIPPNIVLVLRREEFLRNTPFSLQDPSHCIGSCIHLTSQKESTNHCKKAILRETCSILPTITPKKNTKNLFEKGVIWFQSYFMISGGDYITITFTFECFQVILGSLRSDTLRSLKASTFWVDLIHREIFLLVMMLLPLHII